jgi:uncharacterized protein
MKKNSFLIVLMLFTTLSLSVRLQAQTAAVGKSVSEVNLIDSNDKPRSLPFLGEKIITIFYTDPDAKDVNDPLSDALKAKNFSKDKYAGVGVANCKDSWVPNSAVRMKARQKEKQFPGSIILLDENKAFSTAWGLGDCNDAGVVIVVGKDKKIKFIKAIKKQDESKAITVAVLKIVEEEMAK